MSKTPYLIDTDDGPLPIQDEGHMLSLMSGLSAESLRIAIHYGVSDEYIDQWISAQLDASMTGAIWRYLRGEIESIDDLIGDETPVVRSARDANERALAWERHVRRDIIDACLRASGIDDTAGAPRAQ